MAELSEELKLEIVTRLARFEAPADIVAEFHLRGIETDRSQIGGYDPSRTYYVAGDKWRDVFDAARKAYLEDVSAVPIANQGYRLNELQKLFAKAVAQNKPSLAIQIAEQCSKEVGGAFTNQRELSVNDSRRPAMLMSAEDRQAALADLIAQAIASMPGPAGSDAPHLTKQ